MTLQLVEAELHQQTSRRRVPGPGTASGRRFRRAERRRRRRPSRSSSSSCHLVATSRIASGRQHPIHTGRGSGLRLIRTHSVNVRRAQPLGFEVGRARGHLRFFSSMPCRRKRRSPRVSRRGRVAHRAGRARRHATDGTARGTSAHSPVEPRAGAAERRALKGRIRASVACAGRCPLPSVILAPAPERDGARASSARSQPRIEHAAKTWSVKALAGALGDQVALDLGEQREPVDGSDHHAAGHAGQARPSDGVAGRDRGGVHRPWAAAAKLDRHAGDRDSYQERRTSRSFALVVVALE